MKKQIGIALLVTLLVVGLIVLLQQKENVGTMPPAPPPIAYTGAWPEIEEEPSEIGTKENPQARRAYQQALLADPKTGRLPKDIHRKEIKFSAKLPRVRDSKTYLRSSASKQWNSIGPYNVGGRTRALAIDESNEKVVLAGGVSGGMWRSEDGANTWSKTTIPSSIHSVSCIAQDLRPGKTNIWYYGTGEFSSNSASKKSAPFRGDGVFKSIDGGKSWEQLVSTDEGVPNNYNSQFQYIWKILPNRKNLQKDEVYVATVGAILRSIDGGDSWNVVLGRKRESTESTDLNTANISDYTDIVQAADGVFYAAFSQAARNGSSPEQGIYRSTDGINWVDITPFRWPGNYNRTVIATSQVQPQEVFFSVNANEEMLWKYTYFSGNGSGQGGRWENLSENLPSYGGEVGDYDTQQSYNMVLMVHPARPEVLFLGGTNLYRSTDAFASNQNNAWIGGYDTANDVRILANHFVDQHALAFFPSNADKMLSSNDGGVFGTEDNMAPGIAWFPRNYGFVTTQFYTLGLDEFGTKGVVMGGLQDNGTLIAKQPGEKSSWNPVIQGDGGYSAISRDGLYYFASFQFGKIYRFTLDQNLQRKTFARVDPQGSGGEDKLLFVNPFILAPENQNVMYFAGGNVIWKNSNISQTPLFENYPASINWQKMAGTEIASGTISALRASYNPAGTLYFGTNRGQLYRIANANDNDYTVEEITSPQFPQNAYVSSIAIDRKNSSEVVISFSNYNVVSLFYSRDGGDTFENISGNLEENEDGSGDGPSVRWVEIVSKNQGPSQVFTATSTGIYAADALVGKNTVWEKHGSETVGNVVVTMIKYFSGDGTIVAATHGNGMYEAYLDNVWKTEISNENMPLAFANPYPNPFNDQITIPFHIPEDGMVRARIYSPLGQMVKTLLWAVQYRGKNVLAWDGTNEAGVRVASGTYICRIEYENQNIGSRIVFSR